MFNLIAHNGPFLAWLGILLVFFVLLLLAGILGGLLFFDSEVRNRKELPRRRLFGLCMKYGAAEITHPGSTSYLDMVSPFFEEILTTRRLISKLKIIGGKDATKEIDLLDQHIRDLRDIPTVQKVDELRPEIDSLLNPSTSPRDL